MREIAADEGDHDRKREIHDKLQVVHVCAEYYSEIRRVHAHSPCL
jgi:hypothetical protein